MTKNNSACNYINNEMTKNNSHYKVFRNYKIIY